MNFLQKYLLKKNDPETYQDLKFTKRANNTKHFLHQTPTNTNCTFKHSGNAGDIIYALPAMYAIANYKQFDIALAIDKPGFYSTRPHPLGNKMLTKGMVDMLAPLLLNQPLIKTCEVLDKQPYNVDLDNFRDLPFYLEKGNITRWYMWAWGVNYDLNKAWLQVNIANDYKDAIVIARSQRYNQPGIDYGFLKKYKQIYFVGVAVEFELMAQKIPHLQYIKTTDFLVLASIIKSCKLFIGNQSLPFALAEATKANRLLEVYYKCPNVNVYGENGYDFYFQEHFEKLVVERYENYIPL